MQRPPDYHTHNRLCKHAEGVPADYVRAAVARGLPEIALTDHCPTNDGFGIDHRMSLEEFPIYRDWCREAAQIDGIKVLFGLEADYYPGCERFLAPFLDQHPFDIILGSVHFLDYWATDRTRRSLSGCRDTPYVWATYFARIRALAESGLYDVVGHFDLPKRYGHEVTREMLGEQALPALDAIAEAGMSIEINTSGWTHSINESYPSLPILRWAHERGIGLVLGSDAHSADRVGDGFERAIALAREAGYTHLMRYDRRSPTAAPLPIEEKT